MSMKMMGQIQQDHIKIREMEEKQRNELEDKVDKFNNTVEDLKFIVEKKLNLILKAISNSQIKLIQDTKEVNNNIEERDIIENTFIPDIDVSDLSINAKEDKTETKDIDIGSSLEALNNLDKF